MAVVDGTYDIVISIMGMLIGDNHLWTERALS